MKPRMTTEQFIARARERYGDAFSFERCEYRNMKTPVLVTCPEHGEVEVNPDSFLNRARIGCPRCSKATPKKPRKYTTESLVAAYREIWGDEFDYSEVVYAGFAEKVKITHRRCGRTFEQVAGSHFKYGCRPCSARDRGEALRDKSKARFLDRARAIHGDDYEYTLDDFVDMKTHVDIRCRKHDFMFRASPNNHLHPTAPTGCPKCGWDKRSAFHSAGAEAFVAKAREVHGDVYDYSGVIYKNNRTKVAIRCTEHGVFMQSPWSHISKSGCPSCSGSRMERYIASILEVRGINFLAQHSFPDCKRRHPLPFDFAILQPDGSVAGIIEYHGDQHFRPVEYFGGATAFRDRTINDHLKASYCRRNGIPMLVATSKDDFRIEKMVVKFCNGVGIN